MKRPHILTRITNAARRAASLWLCLAVLFGVSLTLTQTAKAASWMDPYLNQMKEWGVMKGDANGNLHGERAITRAEFVVMLNRAFGYQEMGANPFTDVPDDAWYADDIRISYKAGCLQGTSATTASPNAPVTREQAVALVGRSLRLKNTPGSTQNYRDENRISTWGRGVIRQATDMGLINGYPDGTFRPQAPISRGQAATVLSNAIGTLVNRSGDHKVGNVYGNLTITVPGVTLSNTIVTGNLYLTGGIGLDDVVLNNVTVGGKIVVCGTGSSQKGESSVILRNVTANGLEIDSMTNQFLSVRAEGLTSIKDTTVRTSGYIEDRTTNGNGLALIKLDGAEGAQFQLAGNIKEVINRSPASFLGIGGGVANKVTVDERATGSTLDIGINGTVRDLNLDTAATVTGKGDITSATVNASGSTIPMLPDTIVVRPGVTGNIGGAVMDSAAAIESSEDPRLLAGYPAARNVAPTSADAVFSANKSGTIYWAVTALTDGSVNETVLLNPATSHSVVKSGNIKVAASKTELTAKLSGLTKDGSYYISAMLVDARGRHSPVKVTAFTTPDDTVPAFAAGYPYTNMTFSKTDTAGKEQIVQAMVMPTKDCRLYYALLPKGSAAPTAANFKTGSITGNLGYGVVDVKKNTPLLIPRVNTAYLAEETTYDLYLWLNDADNGKSSAVKKLSITTLDTTPPVLQSIRVSDVAARSVSVTFSVNEPATLYWAVVKHGADFFANGITDKETLAAKIQIETGLGALKKGSASASKAATEVKFTVSGLEGQTSYDLYYVVKDKAGNYNVYTGEFGFPLLLNTLDNEPPTVKQEFTHDGTDSGKLPTPYPDTSIRLVFSESVKGKTQDGTGKPVYNDFKKLYDDTLSAPADKKAAAREALANALRTHIKLYYRPVSGQPALVEEKTTTAADNTNWVIDYRYATVTLDADSGEMIVTFPYNKDKPKESAINLSSGVTYYFELSGIVDTSVAENAMAGSRGVTKLPEFTTIDAQLVFSAVQNSGQLPDTKGDPDMTFRLSPVTAASVNENVLWDMVIWSNKSLSFELYSRKVGTTNWEQVNGTKNTVEIKTNTFNPQVGVTLAGSLGLDWQKLKAFTEDREFAIKITKLESSEVRDNWSGSVSLSITPVTGTAESLRNLSNTPFLTPDSYKEFQNSIYAVKEIGVPAKYTVSCSFRDQNAPTFDNGTPIFTVGDSSASIDIQLNRPNTRFYYVVTQVGKISTTLNDKTVITADNGNWDKLPKNGEGLTAGNVELPRADAITSGTYLNKAPTYIAGIGRYDGSLQTVKISGLAASTKYIAYFVLQGESEESTSGVYAFRFETAEVVRPILSISVATTTATIKADRDANVNYMAFTAAKAGTPFTDKLGTHLIGDANKHVKWLPTYANLTLLEAMRENVMNGSVSLGSVFDFFADQSTKDQIAGIIASGQTISYSVASGDLTLKAGSLTSKPIDFSKYMLPGGRYWVVAVGKSPLGSGYAFSANAPLYAVDNQPPRVRAISTTITTTSVYKTWDEAANAKYSGTLKIDFDENLYFLTEDSDKLLQVVDKPLADVDKFGSYTSSATIIGALDPRALTQRYLGSSGTAPCSSLTFDFTDIKRETSITFNSGIADKSSNSGKGMGTLIISLHIVEDNGFYTAKFLIANGATEWDATGGKLTYNPKK